MSPRAQADLSAQYIKSAVKNVPSVFLMTDSQVAEEQFLVLINDLLASGEIPGLFADDEVENIITSMRPQVKSLGINDTRETCWKFFIEKVRRQLKVPVPVPAGLRGLLGWGWGPDEFPPGMRKSSPSMERMLGRPDGHGPFEVLAAKGRVLRTQTYTHTCTHTHSKLKCVSSFSVPFQGK